MPCLSFSFSRRGHRRREYFLSAARARRRRQNCLAHPPRRAFSRGVFPAKRLSNLHVKESRGTLLRSNRSRAARRRRQTDGLRWHCVRDSDAARNPCHAIIRPLPTDLHLRRAIARNGSSNRPPHSSVSAGFRIAPSCARSPGRERRAVHSSCCFNESRRYRLVLFLWQG